MRGAKPKAFIEPESGIGLYYSESKRLAGSRGFTNQTFDYLRTNPLPTQSTVYKQLAEEKSIIIHEALQPTNIRPVKCDDPNLRHVPALAKACDLSL